MNNYKKLGVSALAGTLASLTAMQAANALQGAAYHCEGRKFTPTWNGSAQTWHQFREDVKWWLEG